VLSGLSKKGLREADLSITRTVRRNIRGRRAKAHAGVDVVSKRKDDKSVYKRREGQEGGNPL